MGNGLIRLPPGVTGRLGISSPSRTWTYSAKLWYRIPYLSIRQWKTPLVTERPTAFDVYGLQPGSVVVENIQQLEVNDIVGGNRPQVGMTVMTMKSHQIRDGPL